MQGDLTISTFTFILAVAYAYLSIENKLSSLSVFYSYSVEILRSLCYYKIITPIDIIKYIFIHCFAVNEITI